MAISLFPVRVPIGHAVDATGKKLDVLISQEFARALADLLVRVGGENGSNAGDIELLAAEAMAGRPVVDPDQQITEPPPELGVILSEMAQLRQQVQELQQAVSGTAPAPRCTCADLEQLAFASIAPGVVIDWERPGKIGEKVPNTGKFTSIGATGQITSTLATGTAPMVIASTTKVANLNVDQVDGGDWSAPGAIGTGTANTGKFTTLQTTSYTNLSPANENVEIKPTGTGSVTISPAQAGAMDNVTIGATTARDAHVLSLWVQYGFACNGATPQGPYALGAAATDLATVIALANKLQTMAINNGTGS